MLNALEKEMLSIAKVNVEMLQELMRTTACNDQADMIDTLLTSTLAVIAKAEAAGTDTPETLAIRKLAHDLWDDDECTVEPEAVVSIAEEGHAWIQVWRYLDRETLQENGIDLPSTDEDDDGCPKGDPECLGNNGDCHDACEAPAAEDSPKSYRYSETACPSKHWNDGSDTCADCGYDLQSTEPEL